MKKLLLVISALLIINSITPTIKPVYAEVTYDPYQSKIEQWGFIPVKVEYPTEDIEYAHYETAEGKAFNVYFKNKITEVTGERIPLNFTDEINNEPATIIMDIDNNIKTYSIPQHFFTVNEYATRLDQYMEGLSDSYDISTNQISNETSELQINKIIVESSSYGFLLFIIFALLSTIVVGIGTGRIKYNSLHNVALGVYETIYKALKALKPFILILLILALFALGRATFLVSHIDLGHVDIRYILELISKLDSKDYVLEALKNKNEISFILAVNFQIILGLIILLAIPYLFDLIKISTQKIKKIQNIKPLPVTPLFIVLTFGTLSSILLLDSSYIIPAAIYTIAAFILLIFQPVDIYRISSKTKILLTSTYLILLIGTLLINNYIKFHPAPTINRIFDFDDQVTFYPIEEIMEGSKPVIITRRNPNDKYPIFANNLLLYSPQYKNIINTKNVDFVSNPKSDFYILPKSTRIETLSSLINNPTLIDKLVGSSPSSMVFIPEDNDLSNSVFEIETACDIYTPHIIRLNIYTADQVQTINLLRVPNCMEGNSTYTFQTPIPREYYLQNSILQLESEKPYLYAHFRNPESDNESSKNLEFIRDEIDLPMHFEVNDSDQIIVYSMDKPTDYAITNDMNNIDRLSEQLNLLLQNGKLQDKIKFYTDQEGIVAIDKTLSP